MNTNYLDDKGWFSGILYKERKFNKHVSWAMHTTLWTLRNIISLVVEQFWPTLPDCFKSLWFTGILYAQHSWGQIKAVKSGWGLDFNWAVATLFLFFFNHSVPDMLLCLRSLLCRMTQFQPDFSQMTSHLEYFSYTEVFMVDSMIVSCPRPVNAKHAEIISSAQLPLLTAGMRYSCWYAVVCFL